MNLCTVGPFTPLHGHLTFNICLEFLLRYLTSQMFLGRRRKLSRPQCTDQGQVYSAYLRDYCRGLGIIALVRFTHFVGETPLQLALVPLTEHFRLVTNGLHVYDAYSQFKVTR